jgi:two-component system, cell cycle sensor histidine kinase and response regulator CckA
MNAHDDPDEPPWARRDDGALGPLSAVLTASADAVHVKDRAGRYIAVNEAGARLMGRSVEEVVGRVDAELLDPATARRVRADDLDALETGGPHVSEVTCAESGVQRTWVTTRSAYRGDDGDVAGLVAVCRDVTTERQVMTQILHAQKIEAIGQFAGGIVHDFNNVLLVINGYVELLSYDATMTQYTYLMEIVQASERATALTRQLLTFGRRHPVQVKVLDLNALVAESGVFLRPLIGPVTELVTVLGARHAHVSGDAAQLQQVIVNLVVNARDAMPRGGRIIIETAEVDFAADDVDRPDGLDPGTYVAVSVSDSGTGMDPATAARAFEPFFTTKETGRGTGLGLSTAQAVVRERGGHIGLISVPGAGTRITVHLPQADSLPSEAHDHHEEHGGGETVFLVDDEDGVQRVVRRTDRPRFTVLDRRRSNPCIDG